MLGAWGQKRSGAQTTKPTWDRQATKPTADHLVHSGGAGVAFIAFVLSTEAALDYRVVETELDNFPPIFIFSPVTSGRKYNVFLLSVDKEFILIKDSQTSLTL